MKIGDLLRRWYQAAQPSKQHPYPIGANVSQNANIQQAFPRLLEWSRHLDDNHALTIGVLDELVNSTVGSGIVIRPMVKRPGTADLWEEVNEQIADLWEIWSQEVDVTRGLDWGQACRLAARGWFRDGDFFTHHVVRAFNFRPGEVPYRCEFLESEMCPIDYISDDPDLQIQNGVQVNQWNAPLAYYIYKRHPNDWVGSSQVVTFQDLKRIPAAEIAHLLFTRRWPSTRGVSIMHGAIRTLEDLRDYEESERIAARVGATLVAYIKKAPDIATAEMDESGNREVSMQSGSVWTDLLPGDDVGTIAPNRPNPELNNFRAGLLRNVAAATGTKYSSISRNYEGSYSSQRQELTEARQRAEAYTAQFVAQFARPIYRRWLEAARLALPGELPQGLDLDALSRAEFSGPALAWVDPLKEVQADKLAVDEGFVSRDQVRRKRNPSARMSAEELEVEREPVAVPMIEEEPEDETTTA